MKRFGIVTAFFYLFFFIVFLSIHLFRYDGFNNFGFGIEWVILIFGVIFVKIIVIDGNKVKVYRPFGFFTNNSIPIAEISKVVISVNSSIGGSTSIVFYNRQGIAPLKCWTQLMKWETKKMAKKLKQYELEVSFEGSGTYGYFD
jgi:hypothetical protein